MSDLLELGADHHASILDQLPTALYVIDSERRIVFWNASAERISGFLRHEALGRICGEELMAHCDADNRQLCGASCPLAATTRDGRARDLHVFLRHKNGQRVPVHLRSTAVRDADDVIVGTAANFDEEIAIGRSDPHLHVITTRQGLDPLTGLPGAGAIAAHIETGLSEYRRTEVPFALLGILMDGFPEITRTRGRPGVEEVVKAVGETLSKNLPAGDLLGRWSDERFLIVLNNCPGPVLERIAAMLGRILDMVAVSWWGDRLPVRVRMGGTVVDPRDSAGTIMSRVNHALQNAQPGIKERFQTVYRKKESA